MTFEDKVENLRHLIELRLGSLISSTCILADAPYYGNIGDVLIWQGIEDFVKSLNKTLINTSGWQTFNFPEISENVTILLMGGGNFGDLWRWFQDLRLKIITHYPHNRIIMFPQSVWYDDTSLIQHDTEIMARHEDLYLCARDQFSYDFLRSHFHSNHVLLVPDMAFCMEDRRLIPYRDKSAGKELFLRRIDKERTTETPLSLGENIDIRDWPTVERKPRVFWWIEKICGVIRRLKNESHPLSCMIYKGIDIYATRYLKDSLVKSGCAFLAPYSQVTTTRLHTMILSVLLHKPVRYMDNSTGKLSAFADTWLGELYEVRSY